MLLLTAEKVAQIYVLRQYVIRQPNQLMGPVLRIRIQTVPGQMHGPLLREQTVDRTLYGTVAVNENVAAVAKISADEHIH